MDWFTSDLHLGHSNIIKYSKRPFKDVSDMDNALIANINDKVKATDRLWILGDFCFGPRQPERFIKHAAAYRARIVCDNIILIRGNHDPNPYSDRRDEQWRAEEFGKLFSAFYPTLDTSVNGQKISMHHYACVVWDKSHHGAWHLYGHSHDSLPDDPNALKIDCGVDSRARRLAVDGVRNPLHYAPFDFPEVAAIMSKKSFKPIDHHGAREHE